MVNEKPWIAAGLKSILKQKLFALMRTVASVFCILLGVYIAFIYSEIRFFADINQSHLLKLFDQSSYVLLQVFGFGSLLILSLVLTLLLRKSFSLRRLLWASVFVVGVFYLMTLPQSEAHLYKGALFQGGFAAWLDYWRINWGLSKLWGLLIALLISLYALLRLQRQSLYQAALNLVHTPQQSIRVSHTAIKKVKDIQKNSTNNPFLRIAFFLVKTVGKCVLLLSSAALKLIRSLVPNSHLGSSLITKTHQKLDKLSSRPFSKEQSSLESAPWDMPVETGTLEVEAIEKNTKKSDFKTKTKKAKQDLLKETEAVHLTKKREESREEPPFTSTKTAYQLPKHSFLQEPTITSSLSADTSYIDNQKLKLKRVLEDFGVDGEIMGVQVGPVVTLYEFLPAAGIKTSRIVALSDDIARLMEAVSARISIIPGKVVLGIELPNLKRETVYLREMLESIEYQNSEARLPLCLGKTIGGGSYMIDLAKAPHLLVAGTTGSGKSVGINTMILSLLYKLSPDQCRLILIDPKMLELSVYEGIPHLLTPVVTEPQKAIGALKWGVKEMERRYRLMSALGTRNIEGFNKSILAARGRAQVLTHKIQTGYDPESGAPVFDEQEIPSKTFPYIVIVVDEMADLMMVAGKEIEFTLQRLAQMARAAGIHVIAATQRPSVDVITGTIKANFPSRIAFQVTSKIDSRTILGEMGAETLLGQGDMLYLPNGTKTERVHCPFVADEEVEAVISFLKEQGAPTYEKSVMIEENLAELSSSPSTLEKESGDDLYAKAVEVVVRDNRVSISYIQRQLQIGYNRAARIIEQMEKEGIISEPSRSGKREILKEQTGS